MSTAPTSATTVLRTRYPTWFARMAYFDLEVPPGWAPLVFEVCEKIDAVLRGQTVVRLVDRKHFRLMKVEEKFGALRIYAWGAPAAVREIIAEAADLSQMICLRCGNPGDLREHDQDLVATLCDAHHAEISRG